MKAYQHLNVGVTWLEAPTLLRDLQTGHPLKVQVHHVDRLFDELEPHEAKDIEASACCLPSPSLPVTGWVARTTRCQRVNGG